VTALHPADLPTLEWRRERLRAAGLPEDLCRAIAASSEHDLNSLLGLLQRGCPVATALRIALRSDHQEMSA
jgi:hypothetical protein